MTRPFNKPPLPAELVVAPECLREKAQRIRRTLPAEIREKLLSYEGDHELFVPRTFGIALELQELAWGGGTPFEYLEADCFLDKLLRYFRQNRDGRADPRPPPKELNDAFASTPELMWLEHKRQSAPEHSESHACVEPLVGDAVLVDELWPAVPWLAATDKLLADCEEYEDLVRVVDLAWRTFAELLAWCKPPGKLESSWCKFCKKFIDRTIQTVSPNLSSSDREELSQELLSGLRIGERMLLSFEPSCSPEQVAARFRKMITRRATDVPRQPSSVLSSGAARALGTDGAGADSEENGLASGISQFAPVPSRRARARARERGEDTADAAKRQYHVRDDGETVAVLARKLNAPERTVLKAVQELETQRQEKAPRVGRFYCLTKDWVKRVRVQLGTKQRRNREGITVKEAVVLLGLAPCAQEVTPGTRRQVLDLIRNYNSACAEDADSECARSPAVVKVRRVYRIHPEALDWIAMQLGARGR